MSGSGPEDRGSNPRGASYLKSLLTFRRIKYLMRVYITTPIYYPNDRPHIGSLYTTVLADFLTKFSRILNNDAYMLTGLDEHGYKLYKSAKELNKDPLEFVDEMQKYYRKAWEKFQIDYFRFIRTTDKQHEDVVKHVMEILYDKGYIYQGKYSGYYCVKCEAFYPVSRLIKEEDKYICPVHMKEVDFLEEETYYLKITEFKDWIKKLIDTKEEFITPKGYKNEVLSYINELEDVSIARPKERVPWAVELPFDKNYTVYVWVDALLNYLTAIGWPDEIYKDFWPAIHVIGKDILKFHAVIWPILLKMLDIEPPRKIVVNGFWTVKGMKIGKSVKDVIDLGKLYVESMENVEAYRYYLLRNAPMEKDSDLNLDDVNRVYNDELADIVGNGFKRATALAVKKGVIRGRVDSEVLEKLKSIIKEVDDLYLKVLPSQYTLLVLKIFKYLNEYLQEKQPWKNHNENLLYNALFIAKIGLTLLYPVLPKVSENALNTIGTPLKPIKYMFLEESFYVKQSPILFPKIKS